MTKQTKAKAKAKWEADLLPVDKLRFCDWNVNEMGDAEFSALVDEIEKRGFDEPVHVVPIPSEPGAYRVLGGEHRVRAAKALGMETVPAVQVPIDPDDEAEQRLWSVRRNNIRGRINVQRYQELERSLSERYNIAADAARRQMLVREDLVAKLRERDVFGDQAGDGATEPASQAEKTPTEELADRKSLLAALKAAEEEVLLQSADTVQHGYLVFAQGRAGQVHVVVDEPSDLHEVVSRIVDHCRGEEASFAQALTAALTQWAEANLGEATEAAEA